MDPSQSYIKEETGDVQLKEGTGGVYPASDNLQPGEVLSDLLTAVPELTNFAHLDVEIVFNIDSCRLGPKQWIQLAKLLHKQRQNYDAFLAVHGTDTTSFTAAGVVTGELGHRAATGLGVEPPTEGRRLPGVIVARAGLRRAELRLPPLRERAEARSEA